MFKIRVTHYPKSVVDGELKNRLGSLLSTLHFSLFAQLKLQTSPLSLVSVLLFLHNSKVAYCRLDTGSQNLAAWKCHKPNSLGLSRFHNRREKFRVVKAS